MKRIIFLLAMVALLAACAKDKEKTTDLPQWLQEKIAADEKEIFADPQSGRDLGAWIQYTYEDNSYFEYHNLLMSSLPKVYHSDGSELDYSGTEYADYQIGKCCKKFIWKGKSYFED